MLTANAAELSESAPHGGPAKHHLCDVRDTDQIEAVVDRIWAGKPLTGLLNKSSADPTKAWANAP